VIQQPRPAGFAPFEDWWKRIESLIGKADTIVFVLSEQLCGRPGNRKGRPM